MDDSRRVKPSELLPFDVIVDKILPKLPVKSLLRFTSVCKTWCSAIKSRHFVANHLNLNRHENKGQYLVICEQNSWRIFTNDTFIELAKFDFPFTLTISRGFQDCNGLVFLCHRSTSTDTIHYYSLFNPSIRKFKTLDTERFYERPDHFYRPVRNLASNVYGLGFHEPTNDHRVVRVRYSIPEGSSYGGQISDMPAEVDLYSLSADSWHRVDSNPSHFIGLTYPRGIFVRGSVHWFGSRKLGEERRDYFMSVVLFDFGDERFREMELPREFHSITNPTLVGLEEFNGSLAALLYRGLLYLWVMTEYGVAKSWTNMLYFGPEVPSFVGFTKTGIFIFRDDDDPEAKYGVLTYMANGRLLAKFIEGYRGFVAAMDLMESLVLLES